MKLPLLFLFNSIMDKMKMLNLKLKVMILRKVRLEAKLSKDFRNHPIPKVTIPSHRLPTHTNLRLKAQMIQSQGIHSHSQMILVRVSSLKVSGKNFSLQVEDK